MAEWTFARNADIGGRFQLWANKLTPGGGGVNITFVRGAPTQLDSYSSSDPFGDSVASFTFPSITALDDPDAADLAQWLDHYSNVDLYWIPAQGMDDLNVSPVRTNPQTGARDIISPSFMRWAAPEGPVSSSYLVVHSGAGRQLLTENRIKIWEGFITSFEFSTGQLQIQCQGALFQLDHYLQKPFYPARPWPIEALIADAFNRRSKPQLRTHNLRIDWPSGWKNVVPPYPKGGANLYTPAAKPGTNWTGYTSRNTGAWEHALTGFVQDQLTVLITDKKSGVNPGNQWTVQHQRSALGVPGRSPVLTIRDRFRTPDFAVWAGQPGVEIQLSADGTQTENVIYGTGTDLNGQLWRNAVVNSDGSRTDYLPLAASRDVWPASKANARGFMQRFLSEAYTNFGTGYSQEQATSIAEQQLARDSEPGWSGTITLSIDPSRSMPRWLIRAGMTVKLKGFLGTGTRGVNLHIASVEASPQNGTVALTVDTRYRDLLTVAEAQARTRDPLTPTRMLQVNRTSVLVEDVQAPWDYTAGSGFIPKASTLLFKNKPHGDIYPYKNWIRDHPPMHFPHWYVKVTAAAAKRYDRWSAAVPVLTSEKGTINRTEIVVVDVYGRLIPCPFHVSFYYTHVSPSYMPRGGDGLGPSPYIDGAFESVNPATGQAWATNQNLAPQDKFIIGWGNKANGIYQRAGFSPGSEAEGGNPTGMFWDDATWSFDNTSNPNYDKLAKPGQRQKTDAITIYAMFYAEWNEPVYFLGRLFRQNPGTG